MIINSLMNNQIKNNLPKYNNKQNISFTGIDKAAGEAAKNLAGKPKKKDSFVVRGLNKYLHLDQHIANGMAKLTQTKASQKLVDITRKFKSAPARWCDIESVAVTLFYMWNTWKSDKIDEDRKVPSMIQNGAVTIASSAAAALVDSAFDLGLDFFGRLVYRLRLIYYRVSHGLTPFVFPALSVVLWRAVPRRRSAVFRTAFV